MGGRAGLNLTFQLPPASEVVPPPFHPVPVNQRPIRPLFPGGFFPQGPASDPKTKPVPQKKVSSKQRKSYRRSVLHRAALAVPFLSPPKDGSLRHAALACVQQLQGASASPVSTQSANKRPFPDSPTAPSPSHLPPLPQRIRSDILIGESEVESPEKELLRSSPLLENSLSLGSPCDRPCVKGFPSPAPLVFTPCKIPEVAEIVKVPLSTAEGSVIKCSNCDGPMGASHQCGDLSSPKETMVKKRPRTIKNLQKFCAVCEIFYKAGTKCQSCATPEPLPITVTCHVCACLGRETSLVQGGSVCPSCGVTATAT